MIKRAVGICLLPVAVAACDDGVLEIRRAVRSPDRQLVAVSSYQNNGSLVSDDVRVQIFRLEDGHLVEPCSAYRGDYGEILEIRWSGNDRLDITYQRGNLAVVTTQCTFGNDPYRDVEVVPHPVLPKPK